MIAQVLSQKKSRSQKILTVIYSRTNYWLVSKAFNVVNQFLAERARAVGYTKEEGYEINHPAVIDWQNFEDLMLDIEKEREEHLTKKQKLDEMRKSKLYDFTQKPKRNYDYESDINGIFRDVFMCVVLAVVGYWYLYTKYNM